MKTYIDFCWNCFSAVLCKEGLPDKRGYITDMSFFNKLFKKPPKSAENMGRNELCWCGSGRKYKNCHYTEDQKYFSRIKAPTCNVSG